MLVPAGGGTGTCPAGGSHDITGSATLVAPALDMDGTPLAQGEPGGPWRVLALPDNRYRQLQRRRADGTAQSAEVAGASMADGAAIGQWEWIGADSQQWRLTPVPEIDPAAYYTVTARHSGKVLEVQGGPAAVADGTAIDQATGSGEASQRWRFLPNSDGSYAIVAEHSGSCLALPLNGITTNGGPVQQWRPATWVTSGIGVVPTQNWLLIPTNPGYYKIQAVGSGLVLQVQAGSLADGALVQQGTWTSASSQEWSLSMATGLVPNCWYTITARHSGLSLGVAGGPSAAQDGARIEQSLAVNALNPALAASAGLSRSRTRRSTKVTSQAGSTAPPQ